MNPQNWSKFLYVPCKTSLFGGKQLSQLVPATYLFPPDSVHRFIEPRGTARNCNTGSVWTCWEKPRKWTEHMKYGIITFPINLWGVDPPFLDTPILMMSLWTRVTRFFPLKKHSHYHEFDWQQNSDTSQIATEHDFLVRNCNDCESYPSQINLYAKLIGTWW